MKNLFYILGLAICLTACGEKAEEKAFIDSKINTFLEYNEIASITPKMQLSNIMTKISELKMQLQEHEFSKNCQKSVDYLIENIGIIQNTYKAFSMNDYKTEDFTNSADSETLVRDILEYASCREFVSALEQRQYKIKQNNLLLEEVSKSNANIELVKKYIDNGADIDNKLLSIAAHNGNIGIVKFLIEKGCTIDSSVLKDAIKSDSLSAEEITKYLITKGGDVNYALLYSVETQNVKAFDITKYLISQGAKINNYVLRHAIKSQNNKAAEIVRLLLEKGTDLRLTDDNTLIYEAVDSGNIEIVGALIEHGADVDSVGSWSFSGETALMKAVSTGNKNIVNLLLKNKVNTDARDKYGKTAFIKAAKSNEDIAILLLEKGAKVNLEGKNGREILETVIYNKYANLLKKLLERKVDINYKDDYGWTLLMTAASVGNLDIVKQLINKGAYINAKNSSSGTALIYAVEKGHIEVVDLLLEHKANINVNSSVSGTALMIAAEKGYIDIVKLLLKNGADVNIYNEYKGSALIKATENGYIDIVRLLLQNKANVNVNLNHSYKETALQKAEHKGYYEVADLLREYGAKDKN